jgi:predicted flap endonuclease-1-like 5' DNA nuclease
VGTSGDDSTSDTLADFLHRRDEELRELREQLAATDVQLDGLRDEFEDYQRTHPDDMTVVKGIGPVYQWKLRDAGVNTYAQLAAADAAQLRRMLDIKDWQRVDIESWIEQARDWAQRTP